MNMTSKLPIDKKIDGREISKQLLDELAQEVTALKGQGVRPCLAVVLIGNDPASHVYVANKVKQAKYIGMESLEYRFEEDLSEVELLRKIDELNVDDRVHGILVQLPLPKHINEEKVLESIDPLKDVDGFHSENVGGLTQGRQVLTPCTPTGCIDLIQKVLGDDLSGLHAVVVGRSNIVGKPMAALLLQQHCTVTMVHSKTKNMQAICQQADILVVAVGRPKMITQEYVKTNAIVIDVGINRVKTTDRSFLVGDVDFDDVLHKVKAITPVPGGVGPMTIACLMKNTLQATKMQHASLLR